MIIGAFDHVLKKYDIAKIKEGFNEYLARKSNMPTPSDIVNIIDPPKEWCVEKFKVIRDKMKSDNVFVTIAEEKYYKEFLSRELKGHDK